MDSAILTGGVTGTILIASFVIYKLLHKCRFKSSCCGKEVIVSTDLETPPDNKKNDSNPPPPISV